MTTAAIDCIRKWMHMDVFSTITQVYILCKICLGRL